MSGLTIGIVVTVDRLDESTAPLNAIKNFVEIYRDVADSVIILGPSTTTIENDLVDVVPVPHYSGRFRLSRIFAFLSYHVRLAFAVHRLSSRLDVLFFHVGGTLALLPVLAAALNRIPTSIIITGAPPKNYRAQSSSTVFDSLIVRCMTAVESLTTSLSDGVVVLADGVRDHLPPQWSTTVRFIGNLNYVQPDEFDASTPVEQRELDIVFVGRFTAEKGVDLLVQALPRLIQSYPDMDVALVGDGPLRTDLEQIIEREGIEDNVHFTGWIPKEEVYEYLGSSRLIVIPSFSEGVPKVLLEGMASGAVPVVTSVGGMPAIVSPGETGFLFTDNQPDTLISELDTILDRDDLDAVGQSARSHIIEQYSFDAVQRRYQEILTAIIDKKTDEDR